MNVKDKIKIIIKQPYFILLKTIYKKPFVLNSIDTIDKIIKDNLSVCRFGDGEVDLMQMISIKFQNADINLKNKLIDVSSENNDKLLICIPNIFISKNELEHRLVKENALWWHRHRLLFEGFYCKHFHGVFGDASFTRFYYGCLKNDFLDYINRLKMIWDNKKILFVEGKKSRNGVGNDLFSNSKSIRRIICPSENAFSRYDEILLSILNNIEEGEIVLCSLGPTATVLCRDLCVFHDIRSIDIGHIDIEYEWFSRNAKRKINIPGKDSSESNENYIETDDINNNEVIVEIK